jgi:FtsP/CotA-like multicopper oxidase with cupredoxin domain
MSPTIYDPTNDRNQTANLRSYVDATKPRAADAPYVAPLINATPGDLVRITLPNQLDLDPGCTATNTIPDVPYCFNGTNLHCHGLWVSPTGNSDNVLLSINPGVSFHYEYNIPADRPAKMFWYHPHRHGSTALQVSSGMAGALSSGARTCPHRGPRSIRRRYRRASPHPRRGRAGFPYGRAPFRPCHVRRHTPVRRQLPVRR